MQPDIRLSFYFVSSSLIASTVLAALSAVLAIIAGAVFRAVLALVSCLAGISFGTIVLHLIFHIVAVLRHFITS